MWGVRTVPGAVRLRRTRSLTHVKLQYYPDTDSLYIELRPTPGADSRELAEGLVADFDADGNVVGLDIDRASTRLDLTTVETEALPYLPRPA